MSETTFQEYLEMRLGVYAVAWQPRDEPPVKPEVQLDITSSYAFPQNVTDCDTVLGYAESYLTEVLQLEEFSKEKYYFTFIKDGDKCQIVITAVSIVDEHLIGILETTES